MRSTLRSKLQVPHPFILLFALVLLASLLTYLIPAGQFTRVTDDTIGQTLVVPGSYMRVASQPVAPWLIFHKLFEALCLPSTASLMWLILITGGAFAVVLQTGCLTALCARALARFRGHALWIIPILVSLFSVFGFTMGLTTASVVFAPLGIAAAETLGLHRLSGIAAVALGVNAGFTAGVFNPFSVGVAQSIAELPLFSGAWLRWLTLPILIAITSAYIMLYDRKHHTDERLSVQDFPPPAAMQSHEKRSLLVFAVGFVILTIGISFGQWKNRDIVVTFLILGVAVGLAAGMSVNDICDSFLDGCRRMMRGVIVIGIAAAMRLILTDGNILDTITYELTRLVGLLPPSVQLLGMFFFNACINFLITSGSTKAALVLPILTPMADFLGLSRQSAVYAFQLGDGLTNLASPISTTLNGVMAIGELSYGAWIRFYAPLVGIYLLIGAALTIFAGAIGY